MSWAGLAVIAAAGVAVTVPHWEDIHAGGLSLRHAAGVAGRWLWQVLVDLAATTRDVFTLRRTEK